MWFYELDLKYKMPRNKKEPSALPVFMTTSTARVVEVDMPVIHPTIRQKSGGKPTSNDNEGKLVLILAFNIAISNNVVAIF